MPTTFIMVRHGQSEANVAGVYAAHVDTPLSELGREQAKRVGAYLKDTPIDAIYSSDLQRAHDTAAPTAKYHNLPIIDSKALREIDGGEWEGRKFDELLREYPEEYGLWLSDIGRSRTVGGESVAQVSERMMGELSRIAALHPNQTVLIASHALALRTVCTIASGLPIERMKEIAFVSNASICTFLYEEGKFKILTMDETAHLEGLKSGLPKNV